MGVFRRFTRKAAESTHKLSGAVADTRDRLTGRAVEEKLDEYSEVYGEVLLGMHREIQAHKDLIRDFTDEAPTVLREAKSVLEEMKPVLRQAKSVLAELKQRNREITRTFVLAFCACILASIAIGVAIWTLVSLR